MKSKERAKQVAAAAVILGLGVALGAFAAHGLKSKLEAYHLDIFQTGVRYQMYHGLAILALAFGATADTDFKMPIRLFVLGIIFFSGSLYLLACRELLGLEDVQFLGPMTPIGGIFFIIGWLWVAVQVLKNHKRE